MTLLLYSGNNNQIKQLHLDIGKDIYPLCRRCLNGNETVEHLLCECEPLAISWSCIFEQSFGELQQLSHVPVDLFRQFGQQWPPHLTNTIHLATANMKEQSPPECSESRHEFPLLS